MKNGVYSILKARFLIQDDAIKSWRFIVFLIVLAIIMIANTQLSMRRTAFESKLGQYLTADCFQPLGMKTQGCGRWVAANLPVPQHKSHDHR
jgi:hypothetical protein